MPILQNARNWLARQVGGENLFYDAFFKQIGGQYTKYDENRKTYLDKGYGYNPDVYSVIKQQADKHASIPWVIKTVKDEKAKSQLDRIRLSTKGNATPQQKFNIKLLETKAFEEKELDFPLERPNELQSWHELKELEKVFLKSTGNLFYYLLKPENGSNSGVPFQVYILPSHLMKIVLKSEVDLLGVESPISHYMLVEGNQYVEFKSEDVIHVKYANPFYDQYGSHLYGLSPLKAALRNIQSSNEAIDNNIKALSNGGAFGFLHSKGQNTLTADQAKSLKERLLEMDSNSGRLGKIAGVSAEIGFTRISLTTDELKPFDFLKHDQKAICNVLGWSDKLLNNDDGGKYDNVSQFRRQVITDNIMPDNNLINRAFENKFLSLFPGYENTVLESVYDELPEMQEDMSEMMTWVEKAINIGLMSRNEGRSVVKLVESTDTNMDVITVNQDVIPLNEALTDDFGVNEQGNISEEVA